MTLLFNGMASAVASAHLAGMDARAAAGALALQAAVDTDCPHGTRAAPTGAAAGHPPHPTEAGDEDCRSLCLELCMQHFQALIVVAASLPMLPSGSSVPAAGPAVQALSPRHPLLRPPISA
ncbi:CopL family metal-binding regulatory protein [Luteimonas sp. SJ-16]|uniref:CopL family metal-binding regulatory protein n=1 Tax=Luteimonas deserti TaxID=2752306 RepID=A0A7Z0QRN1_9GAMM|nr:CopL family metal-binding regulatory protein [Luteimonas deserti]